MAFLHGKNSVLKLDDLSGALQDLSALCNSCDYDAKTDRPDTQTFGRYAKRHEVTGLRDLAISAKGFLAQSGTTKIHGKATRVMWDAFALQSYLQKTSIKLKIDCPETQAFGDSWKRRSTAAKGLLSADVSIDGLFDSTANAVNDALRAALGVDPAVPNIVDIGLNGFAIGNLVEMLQSVVPDYKITTTENGLVGVSAALASDDLFDLGVSVHDLQAETITGNYSSVDELAATTAGGVGHLHVTAFTGTTVTIKIQHSTDNSVWADLITFTAVTAATSQRIELAAGTSVNRYVRAIISAGTFSSVTFNANFARRAYAYGAAGTQRFWVGLLTYGMPTYGAGSVGATSTFEFAPEGTASGKRRWTGEAVVTDFSMTADENAVSQFDASIVNDSTVTENVY